MTSQRVTGFRADRHLSSFRSVSQMRANRWKHTDRGVQHTHTHRHTPQRVSILCHNTSTLEDDRRTLHVCVCLYESLDTSCEVSQMLWEGKQSAVLGDGKAAVESGDAKKISFFFTLFSWFCSTSLLIQHIWSHAFEREHLLCATECSQSINKTVRPWF